MSTAITRRSGANMRRERAAALRACRAYCGSGAGGHPVDHDEPPDPIEAGDSLTKLEWQASQCGFAGSAFDVLEQQQELKARAEVAGFDDVRGLPRVSRASQRAIAEPYGSVVHAWLAAIS
jgi:hypothetical protein